MSVLESLVITTASPLDRPSWLARWVSGLSLGVITVALVAAWYAWQARHGPPAPGSPTGLALGITGFAMMCGAETLYTLRKRLHRFTRGAMRTWLHMHIYLGLVGAGLVLLHSAGRLHGVAGSAAGLVVVIIVSGLVGRYVYTAAPRRLDGVEMDVRELLAEFAAAEQRLQALGVRLSARQLAELSAEVSPSGVGAVLGRGFLLWRQRRHIRRLVRDLGLPGPAAAAEIRRLLTTRFELQLDIQLLAATRRWLAWWHALHVPLALVMFTLAGIHIVGALYYSRWFF